MLIKVQEGKKISVRQKAIVEAPKIWELPGGTEFEGETAKKNSLEHWVKITKCDVFPKAVGGYGAIMYPNMAGVAQSFATFVGEDPSTDPQLVHTITTYSDGSIEIDGIPYK